MNNTNDTEISQKVKLKTKPGRGFYDFETIARILDECFICHIGFAEGNQPFVIPTCYGRKGDKIYIHGAKGSRMLNVLKNGADVCATVTLTDGIVLARSAFSHSINYRSVVMFGKAEEITGSDEKMDALKTITDHIMPGRWNDVRIPDEKELNATAVFSLIISEASAKIRVGDPSDKEQDMKLNVWAGVVPLKLMAGEPVADPFMQENIEVPDYIKDYNKKNI